MSTDIATVAEFHLTNWWDKNKQRVIYLGGVVAVVALVASFFIWNKRQQEINASEVLSKVQPGPGMTQELLKVAGDFSGTAAAERALLMAAGSAFTDGKYAEAQSTYERFLRESPESPSRPAALLGVAASLDAQGKMADATAKYQDIIQRYANDPAAIPAKSALARLLERQGQLSQAMAMYQDLMRSQQNASYGLESMVRLQNLVAAHPELLQGANTDTNATVKLP